MGAIEKIIFTKQINAKDGIGVQHDGAEKFYTHKFTCAYCGGVAYKTGQWVYTRLNGGGHQKFFCSYKCMRAFDKVRAEKREKMLADRRAEREARKRDKENATANPAL